MSKIYIKTTQNIYFFFEEASIGTRIIAQIIDLLIQGGYIFVIYQLFEEKIFSYESYALLILLSMPSFFYPLVCEYFMQGQTIGKYVTQIQVIKIDGYQPSFSDYAIRCLLAFFEIYLTSGAVALMMMVMTKHSQRLGGLLSGTAVVSLRERTALSQTILQDTEKQYVPYFSLAQILAFSDNDVQLIKDVFSQVKRQKNKDALAKISEKIKEVSNDKNPPSLPQAQYIEIFLKDYSFHTQK